jgi:hypothetical protein
MNKTMTEQIVVESKKQRIWRYVHSSAVTFLSVFLPLILLEIQAKSFDDFWSLGIAGVGAVVFRLVVKALYEVLLVRLPSFIAKTKKK